MTIGSEDQKKQSMELFIRALQAASGSLIKALPVWIASPSATLPEVARHRFAMTIPSSLRARRS
ncbi:MAG: hypothetical protein LBT00_09935 [Spirochaetaceae bacterium]|nr:hypothetical protein [Spirochaetaceae bacterium]